MVLRHDVPLPQGDGGLKTLSWDIGSGGRSCRNLADLMT